jgi:butyryl-CoA dehydrogenase
MYMFQMMNEARIDVGSGAAAIASAAYYASLEYAQTRPQGRKPRAKDPKLPQVPIIEHADVKRMLLFQRAVVEGSLGLVLQAGLFADLVEISEGADKEKYGLLLDLLTPVAKSYPSEMGNLSCSQGIQILGGYGYCDEFPLEQFYRDARIHPIHEGTTGIQGMDLLGRKVIMKEGRAFKLFLEEVEGIIAWAGKWETLKPLAEQMADALSKLGHTTLHLSTKSIRAGREVFLCDATLYLECFSIVCIGWQWLKQAIAAHKGLENNPTAAEKDFYQGKLFTARYFFSYEMPKIEGLIKRLTSSDAVTVDMKPDYFSD